MSEALRFIKQAIRANNFGTHTATLARVESFDPETMLASVQPLVRMTGPDGEAVSMPVIERVPVATIRARGFTVRAPYGRGDIVLVVFCERSIDTVLISGREEAPAHTRDHALDDAVIIGGIRTGGDDRLSADHDGDLVIASDDFSSRVVLQADGNILIESAGDILLGAGADEGVPLGNALQTWLDGHEHSHPEGNTGSPTTSSPDPSEDVKVK